MMENYFTELYGINVNDKVEKKNGLSYVSWPYAWAEVKKLHPDATYTVYENRDGWCYHTDGKTAWVKTGVTVNGIEHIEYLPVMDFKNRSIPLEQITSFDVNKAIQRSLTKAVARHGLGLYIYAGEDLPETDATAGATPVESVSIEHPKASAPATVTVQTPTLSKTDIEKLTQNAKYVYGDEYASKLVELMAKYGFNRPEDVTITAYELIKAQMTKDMRAKKGAA
jgi:hypothetical protein